MIKADHQLTLFKNFAIEFTHVPSGKFVLFDGYLEDFSDDYKAQWSANEVYGRSDPIMTYKNTTREVTLAWGILANDLTESISNLAKIEVLMSMLEFEIKTPPNAEIGSPSSANLYASKILFLVANPHALLCLSIANVGLSFQNSKMIFTAESISSKLL